MKRYEPGQRVAGVTVLYHRKSDQYGNALWRCRCECGNELTCTGRRLREARHVWCDECRRSRARRESVRGPSAETIMREQAAFIARCRKGGHVCA